MAKLSETQIKQVIGQLEASIDKSEWYLSLEDFKDYCDASYSLIEYWRNILKKVREEDVEELINPSIEE